MDWQAIIPTCFGVADSTLAGHPSDEANARSMIAEARGTGASDADIRQAVRSYLDSTGAQKQHSAAQMARLEDLLAAV